jgi:hypothetical protein
VVSAICFRNGSSSEDGLFLMATAFLINRGMLRKKINCHPDLKFIIV